MPELWMPGAQRLDIGDHAPTDGGPAKAIAHITWDRNGTATAPLDLVPYENLRSYFSGGGRAVASHILWDPFTGRICQFLPANSRSKSLVDLPGGTRTNRAGSVLLQIEALFFPYCRVDGKVYPRLVDTPCKGWDELHAWVASWGVPDVWPNGRPESCSRDASTWASKGGWYPHAAVPENTHSDPLSWPAFPTSPAPQPATAKASVSLSKLVAAARSNPAAKGTPVTYAGVRTVEAALAAESLLAKTYVDGHYGTVTVSAYAAWQRHLGYTGKDADGIPGKTSLAKLGAKHGFTVTA
ncbi:endolysin [Streptomyces sp. NPDC087317]|uniref:endolysin n=1 Tax=Streptomyces sp. NPDC087317 TaxID=3365784 RepID=UPI0038262495